MYLYAVVKVTVQLSLQKKNSIEIGCILNILRSFSMIYFKAHFRHILLFYFKKGNNAARRRSYISIRTCAMWFNRFRSGNVELVPDGHSRLIMTKSIKNNSQQY